MRIATILVPTDFSPNAQVAFKRAWDLARQTGAKLYVLHVQDEGTLRTAVKEGLLTEGWTQEVLEAQVGLLIDRRFSEMLAGADPLEVTVERATRRGDPKSVIIEFAGEISADIIVVGLSGVGAMEKLLAAVFGSVAERVIRKAPCPVVVVRLDHDS
jgi:nucleotide-binding universal stress UspA family protein